MESYIPSHEQATILVSQAVDFLVREWTSLGFDISSQSALLAAGLIAKIDKAEDLKLVANAVEQLAVDYQSNFPVNSDVQPAEAYRNGVPISPGPAICPLCGGLGCKACGKNNL